MCHLVRLVLDRRNLLGCLIGGPRTSPTLRNESLRPPFHQRSEDSRLWRGPDANGRSCRVPRARLRASSVCAWGSSAARRSPSKVRILSRSGIAETADSTDCRAIHSGQLPPAGRGTHDVA